MAETTTKAITIQPQNWGIGSDRYLSVPNGCYDWEGLDIRKGKKITLNTHNTTNKITVSSWEITTIAESIQLSNNWYIYDNTWIPLYKFVWTTGYQEGNKLVDLTIWGVQYTYIFGSKRVSRYTGSISTVQSTSWTSAWWTLIGNDYIHTVGSTLNLTSAFAPTAGKSYRIKIIVSNMTVWSISITMWGSSLWTISANWTYYYAFAATSTAVLSITPTSDFNGWVNNIDVISLGNVEESVITMPNTSLLTPILEEDFWCYVGNGNILLFIDSLWTMDELVVLPLWREIVEITKISDQYILWTRSSIWSRVYYWDGISENPTRSISRWKEIIQAVANQGNYHLVFTWGDLSVKKIWKSNWYNKTMLYQIPEWGWENFISSNILVPPIPLYRGWSATNYRNNVVSVTGDMVYFPWYNKILAYWHKIPWFVDALFADYSLKQNNIYTIYTNESEIRIAYEWGNIITYKFSNYDLMQDGTTKYYYGSRWYISDTPIVFNASNEKKPQLLVLGNDTPENTMINIYYALDREKDRFTFVVDESVNAVTTDPIVGSKYRINASDEFTVTKVSKYLNYMFIETQQTVKYLTPRTWFVLTKISWTWDSTITYVDFHNYRHLDIVNKDNILNKRCYTNNFNIQFNEIQFRREYITIDWQISPETNESILVYDEISYV